MYHWTELKFYGKTDPVKVELMAQWLCCPQNVFPLRDTAWLILRGESHILA
jgi:hypothetical protein